MCHVHKLSVVNQDRLRRMPAEYREQLEYALENEGFVSSTRAAVTPIFERIYALWQEREKARTAVTATEVETTEVDPRSVAPVYVGGDLVAVRNA